MNNNGKMRAFALRNTKEIIRDPLTMFFGIAFPVLIMLLLSLIQANIPVDMFRISTLAPGITVFGLSFISLFSAMLIARDRCTSFLLRMFASPVTAMDFLLGYLMPLLPMAFAQIACAYLVAFLLGLPVTLSILVAALVGTLCSLLFIAIGLLCGTLLNDKQVGGVCGALLTNLTAWLSGIWFSVDIAGGAFSAIAHALPFYHAVEACRAAAIGAYADMWPHLGIAMAWTAAVMALAVACFGRKMSADKN